MTASSVAFVVGGARNSGRAAAIRLAEDGADVAVSDVPGGPYQTLDYRLASEADLEETAAKVRAAGQEALALSLDVRDRDAVVSAVDRVERDLGAITHLVVAAGVVSGVPIHEMTRLQWDEVVGTNLTGVFQCGPGGGSANGRTERGDRGAHLWRREQAGCTRVEPRIGGGMGAHRDGKIGGAGGCRIRCHGERHLEWSSTVRGHCQQPLLCPCACRRT